MHTMSDTDVLAEALRLGRAHDRLREALGRVQQLAQRTIFECDPPVDFIGEIHDVATVALARDES
jgi:hypothetical protein